MRSQASVWLMIWALGLGGCAALAPRPQASSAVTSQCGDVGFGIYFQPRSSNLSHEARQLLKAQIGSMSGCNVTSVDVLGLADASGDPNANHILAQRRSDTVTAALARYGYSQVTFQAADQGEQGAMTSTGKMRPMRRRADLIFHLKPKA